MPHVALGYDMRIRRHSIEHGQVTSLPFIEKEHPEIRDRGDAPAVYWSHRVSLTYDSRDSIDIPARGALATAYTEAADRTLGSATSFVKLGAEWRDRRNRNGSARSRNRAGSCRESRHAGRHRFRGR